MHGVATNNLLHGFGCACQERTMGFGTVTAYDVIVINGIKYTADQIVDKQLIAAKATPVYHNGNYVTPWKTIPAGQPLGRVYSYLKASGATGKSALMLYDNPQYSGSPYYVLLANDGTIDTNFLKDQGIMTVAEQTKAEADEKMKNDSPIEYYFKKYGFKVLLIGGAIYLLGTYGKEFLRDKILKPKAE